MSDTARYDVHPHVALIQDLIEDRMLQINTIFPGQIQAYNQETGRAVVVPLFKFVLKNYGDDGKRNEVTVPPLTDVPILFLGSPGTRFLNDPKKGDSGILLFSQRAIDHWKAAVRENKEIQVAPNDFRKFDLNDAVFLPCYLKGQTGGYKGVRSTGDVAISSESGATIGTEGSGSMVQVKGKTIDLVSIVEDQQSQINKLQQSVRAVAASNPLTQPSLAVVESNNILSVLANKLTTIQRKLSFAGGGFLADSARTFLRKAVAVNPATGEIEREPPPPNETDPETLTVVMRQKKINQLPGQAPPSTGLYGWALGGTEDLTSAQTLPITNPGGDADFAPLARFGSVWGNLVGMYFTAATSQAVPATISCLFSRGGSGLGFRYITMSIIHPLTMERSGIIARYDLGNFLTAEIPEITTNLYAFTATNVSIPSDWQAQNAFSAIENNFTNFFGAEANFEFPVLYLEFEDGNRNKITLNPEDFTDG